MSCPNGCGICHDHRSFAHHRIDLVEPAVFDHAEGLVSSGGFWFYTLNDRHYVGPFERKRDVRKRRAQAVEHGELEAVQCKPRVPETDSARRARLRGGT